MNTLAGEGSMDWQWCVDGLRTCDVSLAKLHGLYDELLQEFGHPNTACPRL